MKGRKEEKRMVEKNRNRRWRRNSSCEEKSEFVPGIDTGTILWEAPASPELVVLEPYVIARPHGTDSSGGRFGGEGLVRSGTKPGRFVPNGEQLPNAPYHHRHHHHHPSST